MLKGEKNNQRHYKKRQGVRGGQPSSFLRADHLQHEVDDGVGGLVGFHLSEEVADVVGCASLLPRHKPKELGCASIGFVPLPVLRISIAERDSVARIVAAEEKLPLVVGQCDAL